MDDAAEDATSDIVADGVGDAVAGGAADAVGGDAVLDGLADLLPLVIC